MNTNVSQTLTMRGADGRLYAISNGGVSVVADMGGTAATPAKRAGDQPSFDTIDHESGRMSITPGA
ncbi:hypothetical protein [Azospirillum thermophilum]|uniref:Uncharacterized protein n=1 Tax=Azospirillum thermophilum TaxID=2202148 RepID=A0A2S2CLJ7_9PROT|nr:hypothetical protein [Azospirillum thermophilum]AWK85250.1 hypothetical protein DEW08_02805 [Azospirillum thermophilum]